jgi:RNA polymerase sigma-70 factor (ECF subfamily)
VNEPSDLDLVSAARGGDRRAMERLLARHLDRIHAVCRRVVGGDRDADDAAQEAMIRIVRGLGSFDGRSSFSTWSHRIATNAALDELRRRARRPALHVVRDDHLGGGADTGHGLGHGHEPVDDAAARRVEAAGDRLDIDAALATLPDDFRVAVVLRDVADLDYAEIAQALDVPVGTVKSRIARGRALLVERLGNQDPVDGRPTTER